MTDHGEWTVAEGEDCALSAFLRAHLPGRSWSDVKRLVETGKVRVGDEVETDPGRRVRPGDRIAMAMNAPRPRPRGEARVVFDDTQVVVIDKPAGVMSVPFERDDRGTAMDLVREAWRRQGRTVTPLFVVHRLDKDTSGLLVFAKTKKAEVDLAQQFRRHDVGRLYVCVAHGRVEEQTIETELVEDRGDGLRGSSDRGGKRAVTHVRPVRLLRDATLCEVRLETGKTHQIRIHLSERGHPLVGERVYIRDWVRDGREPIASPRLLLHAAELGFVHPTTGQHLSWTSPLPPDFTEVLRGLELKG